VPVNLLVIQQRIAAGDEHGLSELYHHYHKRLQLFAKALLRSAESAEEIVEDVFVQLWCNRHAITAIDNLTVYLYVAVKNRSLNMLSKKSFELTTAPFDFLNIEINEAITDPHTIFVTAEMMNRMQKAIDELPPRCKMIFKLIREDNLRYKEVAQILNISVNTIDAQMAIAVKRICEELGIDKSQKLFSPSFQNK
jgi:RNA polymerase sigma-70 factor (family 1)